MALRMVDEWDSDIEDFGPVTRPDRAKTPRATAAKSSSSQSNADDLEPSETDPPLLRSQAVGRLDRAMSPDGSTPATSATLAGLSYRGRSDDSGARTAQLHHDMNIVYGGGAVTRPDRAKTPRTTAAEPQSNADELEPSEINPPLLCSQADERLDGAMPPDGSTPVISATAAAGSSSHGSVDDPGSDPRPVERRYYAPNRPEQNKCIIL